MYIPLPWTLLDIQLIDAKPYTSTYNTIQWRNIIAVILRSKGNKITKVF